MSGPLHAIMRGQYTHSYQSADERARNRAAAATVLGTLLIGGALYFATTAGTKSARQVAKDASVTKEQKERIEKLQNKVEDLENEARAAKENAEGSRLSLEKENRTLAGEAENLNTQLQKALWEIEQQAQDLALVAQEASALRAEAIRREQSLGTCATRAATAEKEAKSQRDHSASLLQENEKLQKDVQRLTEDAQKAAFTAAELEHEKGKHKVSAETLEKASNAIAELRASSAASQKQRLEEKENLRKAKEAERHANVQLESASRSLADVQAQLTSSRDEREKDKERARKADETAARLQKENDALGRVVKERETDQARLADLTASVTANKQKIEELERALSDARAENDGLKKFEIRVADLDLENKRLADQVAQQQHAAERDKNRIGELEAETTNLKGQTARMKALTASVTALQKSLADATKQQTEDHLKILSSSADAAMKEKAAEIAEEAARGFAALAAEQQVDMVEMCSRTQKMLTLFMKKNAEYVLIISEGMEERAQMKADNAFLDRENQHLAEKTQQLLESEENAAQKKEAAVAAAEKRGAEANERLIKELKIQIKGLDKRASKAESELRDVRAARDEQADLLRKAEASSAKAKEDHDEVARKLNLRIGEIEAAGDAALQDLSLAKQNSDEYRETLGNERAQLRDARSENARLASENDHLNEQVEQHKKAADQISASMAAFRKDFSDQAEELGKLKTDAKELDKLKIDAKNATDTIIRSLVSVITDMANEQLGVDPTGGWLTREMGELQRLGIFTESETANLRQLLSDTISVAITSSREVEELRAAEQNYANALNCAPREIHDTIHFVLQDKEAQAAELAGVSHQNQYQEQVLRDQAAKLQEAYANLAGEVQKNQSQEQALGEKTNLVLGQREELESVSKKLGELVSALGSVDEIRSEINGIAEEHPGDYKGLGQALGDADDPVSFLQSRLSHAELVELYSRLLKRRLSGMAENLVKMVKFVCKLDNSPAYDVSSSAKLEPLYKWASQSIDSWVHRNETRKRGEVLATTVSFDNDYSYSQHASGVRQTASRPRRKVPGGNPVDAHNSPMVQAFGTNPDWHNLSEYAMGQYFVAQRIALVCMLTLARASAISRAARSVTLYQTLSFGPRSIALPKADSAGDRKAPRKRAFV